MDKVDLRKREFRAIEFNSIQGIHALKDADLEGCIFIDCILKDVSFESSNLKKCKFIKCKEMTGLYFNNCVLRDGIFEDCVIKNTNFNDCPMTNIKFEGVKISDSKFKSCILAMSTISMSDIVNCDFRTSRMAYLIITDTYIKICDFSEINFKEIQFRRLFVVQTEFVKSIFTNSSIYASKFEYCDFFQAKFKKVSLVFMPASSPGQNRPKNDVTNSTFEEAIFTGFSFNDIFNDANENNLHLSRDEYFAILDEYIEGGEEEEAEEEFEAEEGMGFPENVQPHLQTAIVIAEEAEEDEDYDEAPEDLGNKDKCFWAIGPYDIKNTDYLTSPNHFLIQLPGGSSNYDCASLSDMKRTAKSQETGGRRRKYYKGYYECSQAIMDKVRATNATPLFFRPGVDYNDTVEYVQFGTSSKYYVKKPEWLWNGPIPEPKKFKLVQDSPDLKYFVSKSMAVYQEMAISDTHCDLRDNGYVYRLEPILEGGKRVKKTNKKTVKKVKKNKKTIKKVKKNKKTVKRVKKNKKTVKRVKKNKKTKN